jgi:hypothetical protein
VVLFLALSCLQGRPMRGAFDELSALGCGVQLTPGNEPTRDFEGHVGRAGVPVRTHHGFSFSRRVAPVWSDDGACVANSDSVHPPRHDSPAAATFTAWLERRPERVLETMYPGYCLGTGAELEQAMALGVRLAVDVSHLFIHLTQGVLSQGTLARVFDYPHVCEVHVSMNDGRHDSHRLLRADAFGLAWAKARTRDGTPLVHEAYLHRATATERRRQLELLDASG